MSADFRRYAWSFFEFRPHLCPVEWAESELFLSSLVTAQPGPYSTFSRAHVREPLNCFGDTTTTDLVLCWAAQTDKSTTLTAGTLYRVKNRPAPGLLVFPNEDLAGSYSENRLIPLIDSSDQLNLARATNGVPVQTLSDAAKFAPSGVLALRGAAAGWPERNMLVDSSYFLASC